MLNSAMVKACLGILGHFMVIIMHNWYNWCTIATLSRFNNLFLSALSQHIDQLSIKSYYMFAALTFRLNSTVLLMFSEPHRKCNSFNTNFLKFSFFGKSFICFFGRVWYSQMNHFSLQWLSPDRVVMSWVWLALSCFWPEHGFCHEFSLDWEMVYSKVLLSFSLDCT